MSDAVRDRTAIVSKTKNMREIQEAYHLIVQLQDPSLQTAEIFKKFVWMASLENCIQFDHLGLFVRLDEGTLFKVLEVRKSDLEPMEDSGLGLFACIDFARGEVVTIYVGKEILKM